MKVSRAPVRDAVAELEQEGLLIRPAGRGVVVRLLGHRDVEEICSLRLALERLAVQRVVRSATPAQLRQLAATIDEAKNVSGPSELALADLRFHETLVRAADHDRLLSSWLSIRSQIRLLMVQRNLVDAGTVQGTPRAHGSLLAVLQAGDEKLCLACWNGSWPTTTPGFCKLSPPRPRQTPPPNPPDRETRHAGFDRAATRLEPATHGPGEQPGLSRYDAAGTAPVSRRRRTCRIEHAAADSLLHCALLLRRSEPYRYLGSQAQRACGSARPVPEHCQPRARHSGHGAFAALRPHHGQAGSRGAACAIRCATTIRRPWRCCAADVP